MKELIEDLQKQIDELKKLREGIKKIRDNLKHKTKTIQRQNMSFELNQTVYVGIARDIMRGEITKITKTHSESESLYTVKGIMYSENEISETFEEVKQETLKWAKNKYNAYIETINNWSGIDKDLIFDASKTFAL